MIKIYHNPRCRKSREALKILEDSGKEFEIINYTKEPITVKNLFNIVNLLNIEPIDLVRKNETIWKEQFKSRDLTDKQVIEAMIDYPKLMERPIVIRGNKAEIGRPTERIINLLK